MECDPQEPILGNDVGRDAAHNRVCPGMPFWPKLPFGHGDAICNDARHYLGSWNKWAEIDRNLDIGRSRCVNLEAEARVVAVGPSAPRLARRKPDKRSPPTFPFSAVEAKGGFKRRNFDAERKIQDPVEELLSLSHPRPAKMNPGGPPLQISGKGL